MRERIFRNVSQWFLIDNGLDLTDGLILDYLIYFRESNSTVTEWEGSKCFFWCSPKKMLADLPILHFNERQLRRHMQKFIVLGIVERKLIKRRPFLYISIEHVFAAMSDAFGRYRMLSEEQEASLAAKIQCLEQGY